MLNESSNSLACSKWNGGRAVGGCTCWRCAQYSSQGSLGGGGGGMLCASFTHSALETMHFLQGKVLVHLALYRWQLTQA